ncbi:hypothetical protein VT930_11820 [Mycobacterium sherrisii]|uniref:hypothetical protein n=1 Tax=Mycobacterium sherrisii TaxID=243061 RepID=UPI002DDD0983|nr:hypothetical protein [Mycobacterium sherrisii]MEC4763791.1 hypothetical protein [Mycobacterium sherrisii]
MSAQVNRTTFARYYLGASTELMHGIAQIGAPRHESLCLASDMARSAVAAAGTPEETSIGQALMQAITETEKY